MSRYGLIINGRKIETSSYVDVPNPSTGGVVGRMPVATAADLDLAVSAAAAAFPAWAATSMERSHTS